LPDEGVGGLFDLTERAAVGEQALLGQADALNPAQEIVCHGILFNGVPWVHPRFENQSGKFRMHRV
jgi:hypothetical protein